MQDSIPEAIALVGASPLNFFTTWAHRNLMAYRFAGEIWPIHPEHTEVYGLPAFKSFSDLPGRPTTAVIAIRGENCPASVAQAVAAGAADIVVVADGFAERGDEEGRLLQSQLVTAAGSARLIGPNCVGYADFSRQLCLITEPVPAGVKSGPVSLVSQSGALLSSLMAGLVDDGVGLDLCLSIGNGAQTDVVKAIELAIERPTTQIVGAYVEGFGANARDFSAVLRHASELGKSIVLVKLVGNPSADALALTHTASIAGDDRLVDALLARNGAIRVASLDAVVRTASVIDLLGRTGHEGKGLAVVSISGGAAGLCADLARRCGVRMARFSESTNAVLHELAPKGSFLGNPIDLTATLAPDDIARKIFEAIYRDPGVAAVLVTYNIVFPDNSEERGWHRAGLELHGNVSKESRTPLMIVAMASQPWTEWMSELRQRWPLTRVYQNLEEVFKALGSVLPEAEEHNGASGTVANDFRVLDEYTGQHALEAAGLASPPSVVLESFDFAEPTARLKPPFAVKLCAEGLLHKSRIGGVRLGVPSWAEVAVAAREMCEAASTAAISSDSLKGILVAQMAQGVELFLSFSRDPLFGDFLTLGTGGSGPDQNRHSRVEALPLDEHVVKEMLRSVRIEGLVASDRLVAMILDMAEEFREGSLLDYELVEVNPLLVDGEDFVAVDNVIVPRLPAEHGS